MGSLNITLVYNRILYCIDSECLLVVVTIRFMQYYVCIYIHMYIIMYKYRRRALRVLIRNLLAGRSREDLVKKYYRLSK